MGIHSCWGDIFIFGDTPWWFFNMQTYHVEIWCCESGSNTARWVFMNAVPSQTQLEKLDVICRADWDIVGIVTIEYMSSWSTDASRPFLDAEGLIGLGVQSPWERKVQNVSIGTWYMLGISWDFTRDSESCDGSDKFDKGVSIWMIWCSVLTVEKNICSPFPNSISVESVSFLKAVTFLVKQPSTPH